MPTFIENTWQLYWIGGSGLIITWIWEFYKKCLTIAHVQKLSIVEAVVVLPSLELSSWLFNYMGSFWLFDTLLVFCWWDENASDDADDDYHFNSGIYYRGAYIYWYVYYIRGVSCWCRVCSWISIKINRCCIYVSFVIILLFACLNSL